MKAATPEAPSSRFGALDDTKRVQLFLAHGSPQPGGAWHVYGQRINGAGQPTGPAQRIQSFASRGAARRHMQILLKAAAASTGGAA